jgi:hypothetical protein
LQRSAVVLIAAGAWSLGTPGWAAAHEPSADCAGGQDPFEAASLRADVHYLAAPEREGRAAGSEGDAEAREHIAHRFGCLGLKPGGNNGSFQQPFTNRAGDATANVIGIIPGSDPILASEVIVIGAHHDHVGIEDGELHPGANDNASGVAGMLAIAHAVQQRERAPRRTLAFVAFGSEETIMDAPYVEGSAYYVESPPPGLPIERVVYMVNLDMIGSYRETNEVFALGSFRETPGRKLLDGLVEEYAELDVRLGQPGDVGDSDFHPFARLGKPYVYFWTEDDCYHAPCDKAERLDYTNMSHIVRMAFELTFGLANTALRAVTAVVPRPVSTPLEPETAE